MQLKVLSADFVTSAPAAAGIPHDGLAQIALAGRSNVGKSSLINALTRRKIARTSAAPGKTRLANVYRIELEGAGGPGWLAFYLVDLPGYGYARGGADSAAELQAIAEAYLGGERLRPERGATSLRQGYGGPPELQRRRKPPSESERGCPPPRVAEASGDQLGRGLARARVDRSRAEAEGPASAEKSRRSAEVSRNPTAALLLVDSRHPGLEADIQAARWLETIGVQTHIVATKIDKLTRSERARNLTAIGHTLGMAALPISAASGEGLDELWRMIARIARDAARDG